MSGRLVSKVFESALPGWLKPYAAALVSFAREDGTRVFPSVATLAQMVGRHPRSAKRALTALRQRRLLKVLTPARRYSATHYQFIETWLPHVSDGAQLPLVLDFPQGFPQGTCRNPEQTRDIRRRPQAGVTPMSGRGDTHVTRSVSDPSKTIHHLRARAENGAGKRHKTGGR